ncbi:MAG: HAD family hydrolase, partial [Rhizobiaceae bacterium]
VVEGDWLILEQGDRVPADALLIEAHNLEADESLLTGESTTVTKFVLDLEGGSVGDPTISSPARVYASTLITRGTGHALVCATGPRTRIGQIGLSLASTPEQQPRLRVQTARIVQLCGMGGGAVALLIVLLYGLLRGNWIDALLAGIAAGMSLLPEEFPVVLTVFLAMGAWRISQVGVLTRRAAAIEALGSATILCTDKTGTLTENRMAIAALWLPTGEAAQVEGSISDHPAAFHTLVEMGLLASASVPVDPMEVAFHESGQDIVGSADARSGWALVHSYGLSPDLLAMSNVWQQHESSPDCIVAAKGAPEAIASLCRLDEHARKCLTDAVDVMADKGIRVLGVARAKAVHGSLPQSQTDHCFELVGLVGLTDPVRPDVPDAIARCRSAGIRIIMITGDHAATAVAVARQIGLTGATIVTGGELSLLDDLALAERLKTDSVFARVLPEQKLRIVQVLKASGEVVAMTGDGVNDAPSLKAADIGIAMGKRGTDVAREAAAIVLLNDDFGSIVKAIALGRRIYDNIRKAMGFIFAVHVPIAGLALLPLITGWPLLFGPVHIAILEMIIDPVCATVFEAEHEEGSIMQRPPRDPDTPLLTRTSIASSIGGGLIGFTMLAILFLVLSHAGLAEDMVRSLVFFALIGVILALILASRSFGTTLADALKGT